MYGCKCMFNFKVECMYVIIFKKMKNKWIVLKLFIIYMYNNLIRDYF